jgi:hypothetical protein
MRQVLALPVLILAFLGVASCDAPTAPSCTVAGSWYAPGSGRYNTHFVELSLVTRGDSVQGTGVRWGITWGPDSGEVRGVITPSGFDLKFDYAHDQQPYAITFDGTVSCPNELVAEYDDSVGIGGPITFFRSPTAFK